MASRNLLAEADTAGARQIADDAPWAKIGKRDRKTVQLPKKQDYRPIYEPTFFTTE
jgi:hypothetical protein